jgi:glycerophosphoryl diester phosphodiesterase
MWDQATSVANSVLHNVLQSRRQIFVAHVIYTGLGTIVLFPLLGLFARLVLRLSGQPALADQDILYFALRLPGAASFIVLGALLVFILAFEQALLMTLGLATWRGQRLTALDALRHSLTRAAKIFSFALRLVVRLLLLIAPFVAVAAALAAWLLTEYDINFYLRNRPPAFWTAASLIGVVLLCLSIVVMRKLLDWSMSLPLILFTDVSPEHCFRESTRLSRTNRNQLLSLLVVWAAAALMLGAIVMGIVQFVGSLLIPFVADSLQRLVLLLGALVAVWWLANLLVTACTSGCFAYLIIGFFERIGSGAQALNLKAIQDEPRLPANPRFPRKQLVASLIAGVAIAGFVGVWLFHGIQVSDDVVVIAHRGAAGSAPENTLAAVRQAVQDGADWIEIDVQETADGAVVVVHDRDFMKLAGIALNVADGTLDQVQAIDVGSWFGPEFADARVPTLAGVLNEVRGQSRVIIELKYYGVGEQLEQRVVDIVEQTGMVSDVMIMSLSYNGIRKIRALRPGWTVGLLAARGAGNLAQLDVDFLAVNSAIATTQLIRRARASAKPVFVWTVNDAVNMSRLMSLGIDGIITDEPRLAREVLEDRGNLTPVGRLLVHAAVLLGIPGPVRVYRDGSP